MHQSGRRQGLLVRPERRPEPSRPGESGRADRVPWQAEWFWHRPAALERKGVRAVRQRLPEAERSDEGEPEGQLRQRGPEEPSEREGQPGHSVKSARTLRQWEQ